MTSITVNGAAYICRIPSQRVSDLVRELSLGGKRIAIERNGEIVPRADHASTALSEGDVLEIVHFVGGG